MPKIILSNTFFAKGAATAPPDPEFSNKTTIENFFFSYSTQPINHA